MSLARLIRPCGFLMSLMLWGLLLPRAFGAVGPAPIILVQPLGATVPLTGIATFTVLASSGTTMTYQWTKNGSNIPGATDSVYAILSVLPTDAGTYAVKVTNGGGTTTSSNATLIVL